MRYFLDIETRDGDIPDLCGVCLESLESAVDVATKDAKCLVADALIGDSDLRATAIVVRDCTRRIRAKVVLVDVLLEFIAKAALLAESNGRLLGNRSA